MIELKSCVKTYTKDQDKAITPEETVARVRERLGKYGEDILAETKRIDTGRLDIPVFLSITGPGARKVMPTRKQMGKGASPIQAEASALMELTERFGYFSFWEEYGEFTDCTWSEARSAFGDKLMPVSEVIKAAGDDISESEAEQVLDLVQWRFHAATNVTSQTEEVVPLSLFKKLNEFNGSSAGNTFEESIFQGAAELVERHVCAVTDRTSPEMSTIDPESIEDPVLMRLVQAFTDNGLKVWMKDMTLGFPVPTVAAVVYDPATFPDKSEIVYTAGTASSPEKAAIRALTEVAQLGGDFETGANYEASGLPKYTRLEEIEWITSGPEVSLSSLPGVEDDDIYAELRKFCDGLAEQGYSLYSVSTMHPEVQIPTNYNFVPGFLFRERTPRSSLGLFVGRMLAEDAPIPQALEGLDVLESIYPEAHFLPFFKGLITLRMGDANAAAELFAQAEPLQDDADDKGLAAFYQAYALTQKGHFELALPHLDRAIGHCDEVKEYYNLRGVAKFKAASFDSAADDFKAALDLDSGSAMDLANLGLCYKAMDKTDEAIHCLANAVQLDGTLDFAKEHLEELLGV